MVSYIDPTRPTEGKAYTADVRLNFDITKTEIENIQISYLPLSGGIMRGPLELAYAPIKDMDAATKKYIDDTTIGIMGGTIKAPLFFDAPVIGGLLATLDAEAGSNRSAKPITLRAGNSDGNSPLSAYAYLQAGSSPGNGPGGEFILWGGGSIGGRGGNTALRSGYSTSGPGGSAYLQAGGSQTGPGGTVGLTAGQSTDGPGGSITITAGQSTNNNGGSVTIKSGGSTNKNAGSLNLEGADNNTSSTESSAGSVYITGGTQNSPTGYFGGNVSIRSGGSKSGHNSGYIELGTNTGDFNSGSISLTTFVKGVAGFIPGDITLSPGYNSVDDVHGKLKFNNLPTVSQTDVNTVWNNNGVLNIGAGGSSGGGATGDYLPLTGGTITGTTRIESVVGIENVLELMSTDPDCDILPKLKIFGEYGGGMFYTPSYGYLALQLIEDKTGVPIEGDILVFNNNNMIITAPRFTGTPSSASGSGYVYINADIVKYTGGADGGTILASNSKINCASIVASMGADLGYVDSSPIILRNLPTVSQIDVNVVWNNNGVLNIGAGGASGGGGGFTQAEADLLYLKLSGGTVDGVSYFNNDVNISKSTNYPIMYFLLGPGTEAQICSKTNAAVDWNIRFGDNQFAIVRYDAAGMILDRPIIINKATGLISMSFLPVVAQAAGGLWNNAGIMNIGAGVAVVMKAEMDAIVQSLTERIVHLEQQLGRH